MAPRLRLRPIERGRAAGYTLVEIVVAVLLTSVMVTSVFSIALTAKTGGTKSDRKIVAAQAAKRMTSQLKNFVTGCSCDPASGACGADCALAGFLGPTPRAGAASWYLNDPTNNVNDSRGDVWALASGVHNITGTGVLPAQFLAAPYNAYITYTVDNSAYASGSCGASCRPIPRVTLDVVWSEP